MWQRKLEMKKMRFHSILKKFKQTDRQRKRKKEKPASQEAKQEMKWWKRKRMSIVQ